MTDPTDALPLPVPTHFRNGVLYAFSADQIRAARREGYELAKREAQEGREPVARVELMTTGGNAGLATRIVEIDDPLRERPRPGTELYTSPPPKSDEPIPVTDDASAVAYLEWALWKFIDMAGTCPSAKVDPRTWAHVMVYAPKSDEARDAERYRVLRDFDSGKTELAICRWSEHGWVGEWVIEHEPDAAIDAALAAQQSKGEAS